MTLEEAQKVARVLRTADGWCSNCVRGLVEEAEKEFPDFTWIYDRDAVVILPPTEWDDEPSTQHGDVLVVLK